MQVEPVLDAPGKPARAGGRRRWVALAALVTAALAVALVLTQRGSPVPADSEQTAAQNRASMTTVLHETAAAAGMEVVVEDDGAPPLACTRNDGGDGTSFDLPDLVGPVVDDLDGFLGSVREHWLARGYDVTDRALGGATGLSAIAPDGSTVRVLTGPGGTVLSGETLCALEPGELTQT